MPGRSCGLARRRNGPTAPMPADPMADDHSAADDQRPFGRFIGLLEGERQSGYPDTAEDMACGSVSPKRAGVRSTT
jgi:hypothetical protein